MDEVLKLADRIARLPSYSNIQLGGGGFRQHGGRVDNSIRAFLVSDEYRNVVVAALRAYAEGSPD